LLAGSAWGVKFEIGGNLYKYPYYLVDGIYSLWSTLIQPKKLVSQDQATSLFTKRQDSCRKDIEQDFGILKGQFQIVSKPALNWYPGNMNSIMKTCIILHNMIVESHLDATITAALRLQQQQLIIDILTSWISYSSFSANYSSLALSFSVTSNFFLFYFIQIIYLR
jgi:hypothetical protein